MRRVVLNFHPSPSPCAGYSFQAASCCSSSIAVGISEWGKMSIDPSQSQQLSSSPEAKLMLAPFPLNTTAALGPLSISPTSSTPSPTATKSHKRRSSSRLSGSRVVTIDGECKDLSELSEANELYELCRLEADEAMQVPKDLAAAWEAVQNTGQQEYADCLSSLSQSEMKDMLVSQFGLMRTAYSQYAKLLASQRRTSALLAITRV